MDITLTFSDHATAGLQRIAKQRGHADITALCYATMIEIAGPGCAAIASDADAKLLAKAKAAGPELKAQIEAVEIAVDEKPVDEEVVG